MRAVDPAPGSGQARYEIFHDRLAAPILDWRQQRENARLDRARERAEQEAEVQRTPGPPLQAPGADHVRARGRPAGAAGRGRGAAGIRTPPERHRQPRATHQGDVLRAGEQRQLAAHHPAGRVLAAVPRARTTRARQPLGASEASWRRCSLKSSGAFGVLHGHTDAVESIAFSPAGSTLASASGDKTIRLWRVGAGGHYPLGAPLRANGPLYSAAFDPTGQTLASGSVNRHHPLEHPPSCRAGRDPGRQRRYHRASPTARAGNLLAAGGSTARSCSGTPSTRPLTRR